MKLFALISLLGAALASHEDYSYSSYSTAYGSLARNYLAYGGYSVAPAYTTGQVVAYSAPVSYAAAPVAAHSTPAVVPVARVSAQPAVIQNVVDVAQPKLAARRYEIRRPAIQKQFYDIEERIVIRPAGSAVVELETPVDTKQRGPTKIRSFVPALPLQTYTPTHFTTSYPHGIIQQAQVPVSAYPQNQAFFQHYPGILQVQQQLDNVNSQQQPDSSLHQNENIQQSPENIQQYPQQPENTQQYPQQPENIQQYPQQPENIQQFPQQPENIQQFPQQPENIQQFPQQPISQPSFPTQDENQQLSDDSESVAVENPEFSARNSRPTQQSLNKNPSPLFRAQESEFAQGVAPMQQLSDATQLEQSRSVVLPSFSRSRVVEYLKPGPLPQQLTYEQAPSFFRSQSTSRSEFVSQPQPELGASYMRSQLPQRRIIETPQKKGPISQSLIETDVDNRSQFNTEQVIPSVRNLSPEQSQANQARLIDLLTSRGPVTELRSEPQQIRGRVISATPAPLSVEPAEEKINTRRVVVNRPIHTVQEVEVVEPFTKLEKLAVHQPAVVKTAHLELAAVHTDTFPAVQAVTVGPHYLK